MRNLLQEYLPSFVEGYVEVLLQTIDRMTGIGMLDHTQMAQALNLDVELVQQVQALIALPRGD